MTTQAIDPQKLDTMIDDTRRHRNLAALVSVSMAVKSGVASLYAAVPVDIVATFSDKVVVNGDDVLYVSAGVFGAASLISAGVSLVKHRKLRNYEAQRHMVDFYNNQTPNP